MTIQKTIQATLLLFLSIFLCVSWGTVTAEAQDVTFNIEYEPIGDGSTFTATIFAEEGSTPFTAVGMNLWIGELRIDLKDDQSSDCVLLDLAVICNLQVRDTNPNSSFPIRWNWTSANDLMIFPHEFVQFEFTCIASGEIQPFIQVDVTDIFTQNFELIDGELRLPFYNCPEMESVPTTSDSCVIPTSGPWPDCAKNGGGQSETGQPSMTSDSCVIPPSGPWPDCAKNGGGQSETGPPSMTSDLCVIPSSGPWPDCAKNGGGQPKTEKSITTPNSCIIPPSGPWPNCAK